MSKAKSDSITIKMYEITDLNIILGHTYYVALKSNEPINYYGLTSLTFLWQKNFCIFPSTLICTAGGLEDGTKATPLVKYGGPI